MVICAICSHIFEPDNNKAVVTICHHLFHESCWNERKSPMCPVPQCGQMIDQCLLNVVLLEFDGKTNLLSRMEKEISRRWDLVSISKKEMHAQLTREISKLKDELKERNSEIHVKSQEIDSFKEQIFILETIFIPEKLKKVNQEISDLKVQNSSILEQSTATINLKCEEISSLKKQLAASNQEIFTLNEISKKLNQENSDLKMQNSRNMEQPTSKINLMCEEINSLNDQLSVSIKEIITVNEELKKSNQEISDLKKDQLISKSTEKSRKRDREPEINEVMYHGNSFFFKFI